MTSIIGIDAATEASKMGLARGRLDNGELTLDHVVLASKVKPHVQTIASWIEGPTLIAIDAPLGWPKALGSGLRGHRAGELLRGEADELFKRETDRFIHTELEQRPLEVGANWIARTAHAALELLDELRTETGLSVPLAWSSDIEEVSVIEVYPAASIRARWGKQATSYKTKNKEEAVVARRRLCGLMTPEFDGSFDLGTLVVSDDLLDAALCVLAGADFLRNESLPPGAERRELAEREGWIWCRRPLP